MEKLLMCRICLVENVRMHGVADKNLQELYEKLTDYAFVTEDSRPMLACFFCYAKLKQCGQFQRKCLKAEELLAQMLHEDYGSNHPFNQGPLEFSSGLVITPTAHISILENFQVEINIKEELPDVCEGQDDIIKPKEEPQSDEDQEDIPDYFESEAIPPIHSKSEDYIFIPLMEIKTEEKRQQEVFTKKQRPENTESATVAKKPRRAKLEDTITEKNYQSDPNFIQTDRNRAPEYVTKVHEPVTTANTTVTNSNIDERQEKLNKPNIIELTNNLSTDIDTNSNTDNLMRKIKNNERIQIDDKNTDQSLCVEEKPFKCHICTRGFTKRYVLKRHINYSHTNGVKPYKCDVCQVSFTRKSSLTVHIRQHTGEKPYTCDVCQRSFGHKSSFNFHIRTHTGEKPYKCDVCQQSFAHKIYFDVHKRRHTGEKPFKCEICQRSYTQRKSLTSHIRSHTGEKPYKCDVCQRSFAHKTSLDFHIRTHTGEKPYKCDICQECFAHKDYLSLHILKHTGEKPFKCDICQRTFTQQKTLIYHNLTHTGEKPYICHVCQRSFAHKNSLDRHVRTHTGEKPHKCDVCQESFAKKESLNIHTLNHTGETPYKE